MKELFYCGEPDTHSHGDINNDKEITISDLALLTEYLKSLAELPEGVSILRKCEIEAADINNDGRTDSQDIQKYLALICD